MEWTTHVPAAELGYTLREAITAGRLILAGR